MSHIILFPKYKCSQQILQSSIVIAIVCDDSHKLCVSHNALCSTILLKMKLLTEYKITIAFDKIIVRLYCYLLMYP